MGVDRKDYIVVGVDIGYDMYDDENYEFYDKYSGQDKEGSITFAIDYMSEGYFIVGEVFQVADDCDGLDYSFFGNEQQIELAKCRVIAFVKEHFDIDCIPHIIVKTQWY